MSKKTAPKPVSPVSDTPEADEFEVVIKMAESAIDDYRRMVAKLSAISWLADYRSRVSTCDLIDALIPRAKTEKTKPNKAALMEKVEMMRKGFAESFQSEVERHLEQEAKNKLLDRIIVDGRPLTNKEKYDLGHQETMHPRERFAAFCDGRVDILKKEP